MESLIKIGKEFACLRRTVRPELAKTQNELFHFLQHFLNVNREEISEKQDAKGILGQTLLLFEILYVLFD